MWLTYTHLLIFLLQYFSTLPPHIHVRMWIHIIYNTLCELVIISPPFHHRIRRSQFSWRFYFFQLVLFRFFLRGSSALACTHSHHSFLHRLFIFHVLVAFKVWAETCFVTKALSGIVHTLVILLSFSFNLNTIGCFDLSNLTLFLLAVFFVSSVILLCGLWLYIDHAAISATRENCIFY